MTDEEGGKHTEKDKKFLYREITLSSGGVIFYAPIYASKRRSRGDRRLIGSRRGTKGATRAKVEDERAASSRKKVPVGKNREKRSRLPPHSLIREV